MILLMTVAPSDDVAELTRLLNEFLAGASGNNAAVHDRFWADDLIYTGSSGRRIGKADIMRDVRSAPPAKPGARATVFTAEDVRIQQYGTTAIVAFRLVGTTVNEGQTIVSKYFNTGTFLKRNGKWQVASWQATKIPRAEEDAKKEVAAAEAAYRQAMADGDAKKLEAMTESKSAVIEIYGDTAIVRGSDTLVFVNKGGVWKVVASH